MIQVHNLSKSFADQEVFSSITFTLGSGEKIGLVGRNGSGKTTLLKIIMGEMGADQGDVIIPKNYKIGILKQHIKFSEATILDEGILSLPEDQKFDTYLVEKILMGLGFLESDFSRSPSEFSGGYQLRLNLAKVLLQDPQCLLLDEPTNYLDILSLRWLKSFLKSFRGEMIIITHDRGFMDEVTTHTMGIWRGKLFKVVGGNEKYYEKIISEEETFEKTRLNQEKKRKDLEAFVNRFKAKASKATLAQSRMKMLEKMPKMMELEEVQSLDFEFNYIDCPGKVFLEAKNLSFAYPDQKKLIENLSFTFLKGDKIGIIGKNGKGKSTLMNLLAGILEPQTGSIQTHPSVTMGHFGQTNILRLNLSKTIEEEIIETNPLLPISKIRAICGTMMFSGDLAKKKISVLSGGERARVLLAKILAKPCQLLLLDEPTNHLDQESVDVLMEELVFYPGVVVVITHSETLLEKVCNKLIVFHHDKVEFIMDDYQSFLKKYGWEEESAKPKVIQKIDYKKVRAELVLERSRILNPLKKRATDLEQRIHQNEITLKKYEEEILTLAPGPTIGEFQKKISQIKSIIESDFEDFAKITMEIESIHHEFDSKINKIGD